MSIKFGVVKDNRFLEHKTGLNHPENPKRLMAVYNMLERTFPDELITIVPEVATLEQLEMVHTSGYIKKLLTTAHKSFTSLALDTMVSSRSYWVAALAAGGCLKALKALLARQCQACFALVRPPGHHALPHQPQGFCIFNNLALAARLAQSQYGIKRILIIDWDYHHGNGLEQIFYNEREVLYFSTHYLSSYPSTGELNEVGSGEGRGYTINLPLPKEINDSDIIHVYRDILGAVLEGYDPQIVMVAAGFDGHRDDPLGVTRLSERAYGALAGLLRRTCLEERGLPVLLALEGGYDPLALAACVREVITAFISPQSGLKDLMSVRTSLGEELVANLRQVHSTYGIWA